MSEDQLKLLEHHIDLAQFACTGENNVFWVLDLTDPQAFQLAETHENADTLRATRDKELAAGRIPALTLASTLAPLNAYRAVMGYDPVPVPPDHMIYIILCTEGRFTTAGIPRN